MGFSYKGTGNREQGEEEYMIFIYIWGFVILGFFNVGVCAIWVYL